MNDAILWTSFRSGSRSAFSTIYLTYHKSLVSYGCRLNRDPDLVKDSIQDLFLDLWVRRENLGETPTIKYYLFKCLRRRIVKAGLRTSTKRIDNDFKLVASVEEEIIHCDEITSDTIRIQNTLHKLTRRQREAIQLKYFGNLDTKRVASAMSLTIKGAANLVSKGIVALRLSLEAQDETRPFYSSPDSVALTRPVSVHPGFQQSMMENQ